jgi:hypothetical protein
MEHQQIQLVQSLDNYIFSTPRYTPFLGPPISELRLSQATTDTALFSVSHGVRWKKISKSDAYHLLPTPIGPPLVLGQCE